MIEVSLDGMGRGEGSLSVGSDLVLDAEDGQIGLASLTGGPVRLVNVTDLDTDPEKRK